MRGKEPAYCCGLRGLLRLLLKLLLRLLLVRELLGVFVLGLVRVLAIILFVRCWVGVKLLPELRDLGQMEGLALLQA